MLVGWTDILDGEIVNAAWAVAGMVAKPRASRRTQAALDTAAWADIERLVRDGLPEVEADLGFIPEADEAAALEDAVSRNEARAALQVLLAVRLTDAPEADAARARQAVRLALAVPESTVYDLAEKEADRQVADDPDADEDPDRDEIAGRERQRLAEFSDRFTEYLDEKFCALAAALEGRVGFAGLAQVRAEAYNARIVALLGAIEAQVAALADPTRHARAETDFLERYRRQARLRHGFLTPPDFDRRRRVPVADIYVPARISQEDYSERVQLTQPPPPGSLTVRDLVGRLDRTVLLGDPGGGKTTAANVLTDYFAAGADRKVPFLVTLREYAAQAPIERSVAEHVEHKLKTLYQCPAPEGLLERLLLTGRAVVIFDGLDELLDTSRKRDVSDRVEQFCSAYPLTPVLVTSRTVGYEQAQLDDAQFDCYRLGGFGDDDVAEYARKWFTTQEGVAAAEAEARARAFLAESANAKDLRGNPLLLSLMCILYRGAGSLPGDRAGIYARCAELLLRKWDEQRDLYRQVKADHLVEPTIRYLAWWLFTREDSRAESTERELRAKAAEFLLDRGYESEDEARAAAQEFIDFCRGRMWVFSEVGTTANGDKLYAFTHRTFMEYFAAGCLAATSDTPEQLAMALSPHLLASEWAAVGELAIQIKQSQADRAADRVYAALLDRLDESRDRYEVLVFLAGCVASAHPSPATVRGLTRAALDEAFTSGLGPETMILEILVSSSPGYESFIYDEMTKRVMTMVTSGQPGAEGLGLRLVLQLAAGFRNSPQRQWVDEQVSRYGTKILDIAIRDIKFRVTAVSVDIISIEHALAMPGDLSVLFCSRGLVTFYQAKLTADEEMLTRALAAIGRFLVEHDELPWVNAPLYAEPLPLITMRMSDLLAMFKDADQFTGLGLAAAIAIGSELSDLPTFKQAYRLSELPMPGQFRPLFRDWAAGRVEFAAITGG
jgi:hypothetical protein